MDENSEESPKKEGKTMNLPKPSRFNQNVIRNFQTSRKKSIRVNKVVAKRLPSPPSKPNQQQTRLKKICTFQFPQIEQQMSPVRMRLKLPKKSKFNSLNCSPRSLKKHSLQGNLSPQTSAVCTFPHHDKSRRIFVQGSSLRYFSPQYRDKVLPPINVKNRYINFRRPSAEKGREISNFRKTPLQLRAKKQLNL